MPQQIAELRIRGTVQGVGFRPCVWRLAREMALRGDVLNDGDGVRVRLYPARASEAFCQRLRQQLPPLARIDGIETRLLACETVPGVFRIEHSVPGANHTEILPDIAGCEACLQEIADPRDRRYRYPFGNCTHCGPRYSIIARMPYDRANTAMAPFRLCPRCRAEYDDPADRRFHAQPTACADCGPRLWLTAPDGDVLARDDALERAAERLRHGALLAVKATGGFHLACDATDETAIARLRAFKGRPDKPLAIMVHNLAQLAAGAEIDPAEAALLQSPAAPIVLLTAKPAFWPSNLLAGLDRIGAMLPNTPLQQLLLAATGRPLVMTSGNTGGAPPCLGNDEAIARLGPGVDTLLLHDRDILHRVDDAVAQVVDGRAHLLRRARGHAPAAIRLDTALAHADGVLAFGGDLKNAPALLRRGSVYLAPHLGDVDNLQVQQQLRQSLDHLSILLDCPPQLIVCDPHPAYHSRRLAIELCEARGLPRIEVQHHHAHLAACLAEHRYPPDGAPVLGLILDGSGMAAPDSPHPLWGGEILLADYRRCERLDGLPPVALPGGEQAIKEPWRNLLAHLERWQPDWQHLDLPALQALRQRPLKTLRAMIRDGFNAPLASSGGRLFDAVAALLGAAPERQSFEGQAAMHLEALARRAPANETRPDTPIDPEMPLDLTALWQDLLQWAREESAPVAALRFHQALAHGLAGRLQVLAHQRGCDTLALGGGCLHNGLLLQLLYARLSGAGFRVLLPQQVPAGDGGLALGQAVVGWTRRAAGDV